MKLVIIGGGASGMMAAYVAKIKSPETEVLLLEKNDKLGKKLYATGNGRCNFTNEELFPEHFHGLDPNFVRPGLARFGKVESLKIFEGLGILPWTEVETGKIFPYARESGAVVQALEDGLALAGVQVRLGAEVKALERQELFHLKLATGEEVVADKVILATGGLAHPKSGSTGDGYALAEPFGIETGLIHPSIVQLKVDYPFSREVNGTKFPAKAALVVRGEKTDFYYGDILWTDYGFSGPPILDLSRRAIEALVYGEEPTLRIALWSETHQEAFQMLKRRMAVLKGRNVGEAMVGLVPKKLIKHLLDYSQVDRRDKVEKLSTKEIHRLAHGLTAWDFKVAGYLDYTFAQATAGGLLTTYFRSETMEAKKTPGFYAVGEVLDVDGDCGGYNLQWAWTSAYLAASHAVRG